MRLKDVIDYAAKVELERRSSQVKQFILNCQLPKKTSNFCPCNEITQLVSNDFQLFLSKMCFKKNMKTFSSFCDTPDPLCQICELSTTSVKRTPARLHYSLPECVCFIFLIHTMKIIDSRSAVATTEIQRMLSVRGSCARELN